MTFVDHGVRREETHSSPPFWLSPSVHWPSVATPVSAWRTHGPFACWLIEVLRPDVVVELGTHYGFSCFAFAEAARHLGLPTTIHAVDTWQGDEHAGFYGDEVFDFVASVVASDHPDRIRLVRSTFEEARAAFPDASVDLLHIDGRHRYEDVAADYETWRSAVRDGGVMLFHDIAERSGDFGVWRLWDELSADRPSFAFHHGHGLGVLAVGEVESPVLRRLFDADDVTAARIREDFDHLGLERERQALTTTLDEVRTDLVQKQRRLAEQDEQLRAQRDYIDALTASTSWRITTPLRALGRLRHRRS